MSALWERADFRRIAGDTWRPGGLALTRRGLDLCEKYCGLAPARSPLVLDLGCGCGANLELLAGMGYRALGLDLNPPLPRIRGRAGLSMVRANLDRLPLAENRAAAALCECVLSLLADPLTTLRGCWRALKPGGALLFSDLFLRSAATDAAAGEARADGDERPMGASCVSGARLARHWEALLAQAGFFLHHFEDRSPALAALIARLIWYGDADVPAAVFSRCGNARGCRNDRADRPDRAGRMMGYGLWIAQKEIL